MIQSIFFSLLLIVGVVVSEAAVIDSNPSNTTGTPLMNKSASFPDCDDTAHITSILCYDPSVQRVIARN